MSTTKIITGINDGLMCPKTLSKNVYKEKNAPLLADINTNMRIEDEDEDDI